MAPPRVTEHGRSMWMHHGCRCPVCHGDLLNYSRVRDAVAVLRRGVEPATLVPTTRARRRVVELRERGWSVAAIAAAAGVSYATIDRIANRPTRHVSRITANAVLALEP